MCLLDINIISILLVFLNKFIFSIKYYNGAVVYKGKDYFFSHVTDYIICAGLNYGKTFDDFSEEEKLFGGVFENYIYVSFFDIHDVHIDNGFILFLWQRFKSI